MHSLYPHLLKLNCERMKNDVAPNSCPMGQGGLGNMWNIPEYDEKPCPLSQIQIFYWQFLTVMIGERHYLLIA